MHIGGPFHDKSRRDAKRSWYLSYFVPKVDADGKPVLVDGRAVMKRERPYYETKTAAQEDKPRLQAQYAAGGTTEAGLVTRAEIEDLSQARDIAPGVSMSDLARFWRIHHPALKVESIDELAERFLPTVKARLGATDHITDLSWRVRRFAATFKGRVPGSVTRPEVMAYLFSIQGSGRNVLNHKRAVCNFFNWILDESLIESNPAAGIKRRQLPKIEVKEIGFLSLEETEAYLIAAERYDPELVAHEILQLIAGVRADDEMGQFRGEWVLPATREVVIPAEIAKTEKREVIGELDECFWQWWKVYGRTGPLRPVDCRRRQQRLRILSRVTNLAQRDELGGLPVEQLIRDHPDKLKGWPWNFRRRTFTTFHVAKEQSAAKTALILRHRGDAYTLHNSYRGTGVTQAQGVAYFARKPKPVKNPIRPTFERIHRGPRKRPGTPTKA